jgi:uncharacterized protein with HEPN domain
MKMENKDSLVYVEDMLKSIELIRRYIKGMRKGEFKDDEEKQDAVIRRIELLGEAVKRLPASVKVICKKLPWKEISGMRDKLVHDYMWVDLDLVWEVTQSEIGPLEECLKGIRDRLEG